MADTGTKIDIELKVDGTDKAIQDLQRVAAAMKEAQSASQSAQSSFDANMRRQFQAGGGNGASSSTKNGGGVAGDTAKAIFLAQALHDAFDIIPGVVRDVGAAFFALTSAGYALAYQASLTADSLRKLMYTSGAGVAQSSWATVMGKALGVDMGQLSRNFADRISRPGAAAGLAGSLGMHDVGQFDPHLNKMDNLEHIILLMKGLDEAQAIQFARIAGLEELLPLRNMSPQDIHRSDQDTQVKNDIFNDKQFMQDTLDVQIAFARVADSISNLIAAMMKGGIGFVADWMNDFATRINNAAEWFNSHRDWFEGLVKMIDGFLQIFLHGFIMDDGMAMKKMMDGWKEMMTPTPKRPEDKFGRAVDRFSGAVDRAQENGIFGGGERARGAVPSKWMGMRASYYSGEAARLGAFSL